jgi:hypothetical protein
MKVSIPMDAYRISIKLFVANDIFAPDAFVPVFHRWIQSQAIPDHLLIDVADYAHVPDGPGTVLVSSEANFYTDRGQGKLGLLYARKKATAGSFQDRLRDAIAETLKAAVKLEQDPALAGKLKFRTDEIVIRLNDRLLAPNNQQTLEQVKPIAQAVAKEFFGGKPVTIESNISPLTVFEITLKTPENTGAEALLGRLTQTV